MAREESKIQRQNPVPPGRYWIDVPQEKFKVWDDLVDRNKGALQIDYHEMTQREPDKAPVAVPGMPAQDPGKIDEWFIFFVTAPVSWPKDFPPPNTAPDWVHKRSDVFIRPEAPGVIDTAAELAHEAAEKARSVAREAAEQFERAIGAAVLIGLIYWDMQRRRGR